MLGGQGEALKKGRDFSEIELTIIEKVLNLYKADWLVSPTSLQYQFMNEA